MPRPKKAEDRKLMDLQATCAELSTHIAEAGGSVPFSINLWGAEVIGYLEKLEAESNSVVRLTWYMDPALEFTDFTMTIGARRITKIADLVLGEVEGGEEGEEGEIPQTEGNGEEEGNENTPPPSRRRGKQQEEPQEELQEQPV